MDNCEWRGTIPSIMDRPPISNGRQEYLKRRAGEMSLRNIVTNTGKISYQKYITSTGVKKDAILRLMQELVFSGEYCLYGNAGKVEITSAILILIEDGLGDVNYLDENPINNNNPSRNTPLSFAIENGLSEFIEALLRRPDLEINALFVTRKEDREEIKYHPFQKLSKNSNLESMISNGTCAKLFANQKIGLSPDSWRSIFELVKNTNNRGQANPVYYSAVLNTLAAIGNNPRFKEKIGSLANGERDFVRSGMESIKRKILVSADNLYA